MPTHVQMLDLVDDPAMIAAYEEHHRAVWPEVVAGLKSIGIRRLRIYRHGTRLVMVMETPDDFDPARYQAYAAEPRARAWDELMRRYQRQVPGAEPGSWWTPLVEIFDLESAGPSHTPPTPA